MLHHSGDNGVCVRFGYEPFEVEIPEDPLQSLRKLGKHGAV